MLTLITPDKRGSHMIFDPAYDKTNKMACAPNKDSDQLGHLASLIRAFAVHMKKVWVLSYMYLLNTQ